VRDFALGLFHKYVASLTGWPTVQLPHPVPVELLRRRAAKAAGHFVFAAQSQRIQCERRQSAQLNKAAFQHVFAEQQPAAEISISQSGTQLRVPQS
jgi:hypothetical protein